MMVKSVAVLLSCILQNLVLKTNVWEWPIYTGFTVLYVFIFFKLLLFLLKLLTIRHAGAVSALV